MQIPYFVMTGLYLLLTALATLGSSMVSTGWLPAVGGLKWIRVHFITLGVLTQMVFGILPILTAKGLNQPRPKMNWFSWLLYNGGLVLLLIGLPIVDRTLIISGGTLIFVAVLSLMNDLIGLRRVAIGQLGRLVCISYPTTRFYVGGLTYLLIGVLVGTGMWIGWSEPLHIAIPKEVHVHTNLWGYTSLIFAGFIFDLFPSLTQQRVFDRREKSPRVVWLVFGTMALGALGLVVGPWLGLNWPAVVGLALHTFGTLLMLVQLVRLLAKERNQRQVGVAYIISSYLWLLVPVIVAPYIVAKASDNFPVGEVAGKGGPILIYGWILTFCLAIFPYFFRLVFQPNRARQFGDHWLSLLVMHSGSVLFWAGLFFPNLQTSLHGGAFLFWLAALLPQLLNLYTQTREGTDKMEETVRSHFTGDSI